MCGITRLVSRIKGKYGLKKKLRLQGKIKRLHREAWWKEKPRQHRKDRLSEVKRDQVRNFFRSPEVSREFPDKKKVLRIKNDDGTETVIPKRSMTSTTKVAYDTFKQLHPDIKIGLTLFKKLKPEEIVHVSETSPRSYLCQDCANASLKLQAIKKFPPNHRELQTSRHPEGKIRIYQSVQLRGRFRQSGLLPKAV